MIRLGLPVVLTLAVMALAGCAPDPVAPTATPAATASATVTASATPTSAASPSPTSTSAAIPADCTAILSPSVAAALADVPLNDPAFAPTGVQADGSLVCVWADPGADTTGLRTSISRVYRGDALDRLNALADQEGFTCYTPDGGTRCEKTWADPTYPVTDGRTLFWRDDVLIDTQYSNLAPAGFTAGVIAAIWG